MSACVECMCMLWGRAEIDVHCCFSQFFHSLVFNLEHLTESTALSFSYTTWPPSLEVLSCLCFFYHYVPCLAWCDLCGIWVLDFMLVQKALTNWIFFPVSPSVILFISKIHDLFSSGGEHWSWGSCVLKTHTTLRPPWNLLSVLASLPSMYSRNGLWI